MRKITKHVRLGLYAGIFGVALALVVSVLAARWIYLASAIELAEITPDDWSLELIFFDSTVNKGKTPLTAIDWQIDESTASDTFSRTITMQINYQNNIESGKAYEPGQLQIKVPNPFKQSARTAAQFNLQVAVGANNASQTSYAWNYNYNNYDTSDFVFTNAESIAADEQLQGSIQVVYYLTSNSETREKYDDSCEHVLDASGLKATMNETVETNTASVYFKRVYQHPWTLSTYFINKTASKIQAYDNLGDGADQYIWVRYKYTGKSSNNSYMSYTTRDYQDYVGLSDYKIRDKFPDGVKLLDGKGVEITPEDDGYLDIKNKGSSYTCYSYYICREIYVGYPISAFNEEAGNMTTTSTAELRGTYSNKSEEEELATKPITINLADFLFSYPPGNDVSIKETYCGNISATCRQYPYYQQEIVRNGSTARFNNIVSSQYHDATYDLVVGNDLTYYLNDQGELTKMNDEDFYYKSMIVPSMNNMAGTSIPNDKYQPKVYVRYRGSDEYVLFQELTGTSKTVSFPTDGSQYVQGWYVVIPGMTEGVSSANFYTDITLKSTSLTRNGTLYNFDYVQYVVDGTVRNTPALDSYASDLSKTYIAPYDLEHYGSYMQRSFTDTYWEYHDIGDVSFSHMIGKTAVESFPTYDPADESFKGNFMAYATLYDSNTKAFKDMELNLEQMEDKDFHHEFDFYDLLPMGMEPNGTPAEIAATAGKDYCSNALYGTDGNKLFINKSACTDYAKEHTTVTITKNWHETGRTHIKVHFDFSEKPFTLITGSNNASSYSATFVSVRIPYKVSYDAYAEFGRTYTNYIYADTNDYEYDSGTVDDGRVDSDAGAADINDNGDTAEKLRYSSATTNLLSATSTSQSLQTSILTKHNGKYDIEPAKSGADEDYSYKIRFRTGPSRTTNVILYDHLEEAYADENYWQGSFDGVDVSYAEGYVDYNDKPIHVKVYWSPKADAGLLSEDSSWSEYDEATTNKTIVRSLAFEYLDPDGNPSVLTQATYSYVIIKMKAPNNGKINTLAYNNAHSQWNAIDNLTGQIIYNINGVESNTVVAFLNEYYDIVVRKNWSDYDNYYKMRPQALNFSLYKDDELVETKAMNIANGEMEIRFEGINTVDYELYRVEEESIRGYGSAYTIDPVTLEYTFKNQIMRSAPIINTLDNGIAVFVIAGVAALSGGVFMLCMVSRRRFVKKQNSITVDMMQRGSQQRADDSLRERQ